ncbi:ABC transporter permease [Paenibacillus terrae HPL-003]|uniref:ABC transporter permease n=1 Tax=Paenibacillus terrae (strain HPL-003) TaxID=985665 RepID=G7VQQ3_PAETH|nr:ABC transporter permease subunit [Paenibacillus terrae]AET61883.1 ABC transporter permease [Paenibacillus terrae HPL-003]
MNQPVTKSSAMLTTDSRLNGRRLASGRKNGFFHELIRNRILFLMLLPTLIFFFINSYIPMVGIYYAFTQFDFNTSLFDAKFVGLQNFQFLWQSGTLTKLTLNTVGYNAAFILFGNVLAIALAILLNELRGRYFKKIAQSVMFLPYFVSFVILSVIVYNIFNYDNGFLNTLLLQIGGERVDVYNQPWVWIFLIILFYLWKNLGYSMVIYLAAITGISDEYYEAAKMDGANIFQRIWYITVPMLKSTFVVLLLFALGSIMKGQFDLFYQLIGNNGVLYNTTDILDTYVYRSLKVTFDVGMASAAGVYQSLFGFILIMTVNYIIRKLNDEYALF